MFFCPTDLGVQGILVFFVENLLGKGIKRPFVVASPIIRLPQSPSVRIINICLGFKTVLVWSL